MQINQWIKEKSKIHTTNELYKMYEECIKETGSMMSEKTYLRLARKLFHEVNGSGDIQKENNLKREITKDKQYLELKSFKIKTQEEILEFAKIDTKIWDIDKCIVNTWGKEGNSNYQIKCWLKKKKINHDFIKDSLIKELKNYSPKTFSTIKRKDVKDSYLLKIDIPDFHLGLLAWNEETGDGDFDLKIAKPLYADCINYFINIAKSFNISKILFPVGSDYFNVNNALSTTAKGTFQDEDCRWQKSFIEGKNILVQGLNTLREIADVDAIVIPGNHDEERIFYIGEVLSSWYRKDKHVNIDNNPRVIKYYEWQKNLIGITHGSGLKLKDLPLTMATDMPEAWGRTTCWEFHTGHLHHEIVNEIQKVKVRVIPSLSPKSAYSAKKAYNSSREAIAHIYHPTQGNIAQFNYRV